MADNTLLITPADSHRPPADVAALLTALRGQGMIAESLGGGRYAVGDNFPRLLSFMGCSPYFKLAPDRPGDRDFCHLEVLGPWPAPRLLGRLDAAAPRCPTCRKPDRGWRDRDPAPRPDQPWICPHCDHRDAWGRLDWRHRAGFARFALVLHHIAEGEVVPGPSLLQTLSAASGGEWTWFYA